MEPTRALERIKKTAIIAVLRGDFPPRTALAVCEALLAEGLDIVELTYNSPDWRDSLPALLEALGDQMLIGMGTVLNPAQVREAAGCGAQFTVAPSFDPASVATAQSLGLLMAPGVGTASEAVRAAAHGARLLKFFPAGALGVNYLKAMRGPLNDIDFTCNGYMHVGNVGEFLRAGAVACGVAGDGLAGSGSRPVDEIRAIARDLAGIVRDVRAG
jgi:Entner-Doudoroff aldolase